MKNPARLATGGALRTQITETDDLDRSLPATTDTIRQPCRLCPLCACGYVECRTAEVEAVGR